MVQSHIKSLLYTYDCVIIPNFGGLITHYTPAKIHPVKHMFSPPSKRIAFNEQLKVNDGLLISTLAQKQQWPMPQAQLAVAEFVLELKNQLHTQHRFELQDVGVFRYNAEHKLVFESLESDNFLESAFGLPELVAKPLAGKETLVLRGNYQDQPAQAGGKGLNQRLRKLYRIGASLVLGGISISAIYLLSLNSDVALSSLNPISLLSNQETTTDAADLSIAQEPETMVFGQEEVIASYNSLPVDSTMTAELAAEDSVLASFPQNTSETSAQGAWMAETPVSPAIDKKGAITSAPTKAPTVVKETKAVVPVAEATKPAVAVETTNVKRKTGRFYLIMGVFSKDNYAEMNRKRLHKKGYNAKVITPAYDTNRQRVSVADFATEAEAYAALPALRSKISNELWIFNY
jgi:cell division protein FtsN